MMSYEAAKKLIDDFILATSKRITFTADECEMLSIAFAVVAKHSREQKAKDENTR